MSTARMWFGNTQHAQWVPCPSTGADVVRSQYSETIRFVNGGAWTDRSFGSHLEYRLDFPVQDSSVYDGIEAFSRFASGEYGGDYIRFVDPMRSDENLFNEGWAAPGIAEQTQGAKPISLQAVSYSDTDASDVSDYGYPARSATYTVTSTAGLTPTGQNETFTLLVPSGYTIHVGGYGAVTGDGGLFYQTLASGTWSAPAALSLGSAAPAFTSTFASSSYDAVRFFVGRDDSGASTVTVAGLWAQAHPTGVTPMISRFIPGKGHSGLKFSGTARPERYVMADRHLVGASIELIESEPWA